MRAGAMCFVCEWRVPVPRRTLGQWTRAAAAVSTAPTKPVPTAEAARRAGGDASAGVARIIGSAAVVPVAIEFTAIVAARVRPQLTGPVDSADGGPPVEWVPVTSIDDGRSGGGAAAIDVAPPTARTVLNV